MVNVDFDTLKKSEKYYLMTSTIVPRPIAVVSTLNETGTDNLASFSYFNAVSSEPAIVMFSVTHGRDGHKKDTLVNIERMQEFVIHIAQADQVSLVERSGETLPYDESEREKLGLTQIPSTWIKTPRVKEFKVAYECVLEKLVVVGSSTVVFGRILGAHISKSVLLQDPVTGGFQLRADSYLLDPLARMDRDYGKTVAISDAD
jgi:flavin reductase (DIM6/NTAB) family NADH-FMN oxidoreductase RutF